MLILKQVRNLVAILLTLNKCSYFVDFIQVKNLIVILLTLKQIKNQTDNKTLMGETGCLSIFFLLFGHHFKSPDSTLASQTCKGLHQLWTLSWHKAFFKCLGIQFFNLLTRDLWDAIPHQRSPTLIPREAEDFPTGDNHSKHVHLSTYLAWL